MRFLILVTLAVCAANAKSVKKYDEAMEAVSKSQRDFSLDFFKSVGNNNKGNLITSPLSVHSLLSMVAMGARGETLKEMQKSLHFPKSEDLLKKGMASLLENINKNKDVIVEMANNVLVSKDVKLKSEYNNVLKSVFGVEASQFDFSKVAELVDVTNNWCSEKTHKKIQKLLELSDIDSQTVMILLNAVYFNGKWLTKFEKKHTEEAEFYVKPNSAKNVSMMQVEASLFYGVLPEIDARFVEIPYSDEVTKMVVILPNKIDGLSIIENNLHLLNRKLLSNRGYETEINLFLPKFKVESTIDLKPVLVEMGLGMMFNDQANFSDMTGENLQVGKAIQKAFIEVDEEGTEAAAATAFTMMLKMAPIMMPPTFFNVDRPFYYFITNGHATLFQGRIMDPTL